LSDSADDRFREMFFEEARELLISLEEGLMDLERRQSDRAHLDKTFRAAHSLKGAAAMVGLGSLAEFTHHIEAVLEKIRAGMLVVDSDIITTLLEARDHLAAMVEAESARSPIPASGELTQRLISLLRGPSPTAPAQTGDGAASRPANPPTPPGPAPPPDLSAQGLPDHPPAQLKSTGSPKPGSESPEAKTKPRAPRKKKTQKMSPPPGEPSPPESDETTPNKSDPALKTYRVTLTPGPDVLRRGINPLGVLDELRELGEASIVTDPDQVPPLDQIDPERCYLSWTMTLKTDVDPERISEAFLFFAEDSTAAIQRLSPQGKWVPVRDGEAAAPAMGGVTPAPAAKKTAPTVADAPVPQEPAPLSRAANGSPLALPAATPPTAAQVPLPAPSQAVPALPRMHARIRVDATQLDDLVGLAGELVVVSDNLMGLREIPGAETWIHALEALQRVSRQIRDTTLDLRMVPVDELFSRFPRVVRDLADRSGKEIELRIVGQETRLDRTIVERLSDPMIHLIRNAVDHALEHPSERVEKGKPRVGRITLWAGHEGDRVAIRVEDNGRGLDREKIVKKGIALGMVPTGTPADDPRVVGLIFEPGFSTRDTVSELSGRGVGLDVVRDAVRALRGSVAVESSPGKGTAFIFRLPLTLALIDGLLVETAGGRYVVPLAQVEECVALNGMRSALAQGRPCVAVRGELVPMVSLRNLFRATDPSPMRQELLLTRHAGQRVGVAVDRLVGRVQAVIQSLGEGLHGLNRFSGATILGDGSVSLILDLSALVSESRFAEHSARSTPFAGGTPENYS
jgi:two-component system, chemotaxis family, sensor kinase CheA